MLAWYVTGGDAAASILSMGTPPRSCWTTDEDLLDRLSDDFADPVVLEIETDGLDASVLGFSPDRLTLAEPGTVGKSDEEVLTAWDAIPGDGDWLDSARIVGTFRITGRIPPAAFTVRGVTPAYR